MVSQYNTIFAKDISVIYDLYDNVYPIERSIKQYTPISADGIQNLLNEVNNANERVMPITWAAISQNFTTYDIYSICYGNGKFVAVGYNGSMWYSTDGITWTSISQSILKDAILSVCYGNRKFIAGEGGPGYMAYSTDGITWTKVPQSIFMDDVQSVRSICYADGKFVAVGSNTTIAYSTDGINWITVLESSGSGYPFRGHIHSVCYGNGKFIAGGDYSAMGYSTDGITWKAISQDFTTSHIKIL